MIRGNRNKKRSRDWQPGDTWLFVVPWELHHVGGVNQVALNLAAEMRSRNDVEPLIAVNTWGQKHFLRDEYEGIQVIRLWSPTPWTESRRLLNLVRYVLTLPLTILRLGKILRQLNVRVVNIHYPGLSDVNWVILQKLGLFQGTVIVSVHGLEIRNSLAASTITRFFWRTMLRACDAVVACSHGLASETTAGYRSSSGKTTTIYNGINVEKLEYKRQQAASSGAPLPTRSRYIVNVGTFEHKKGHDVLIDAFGLIAPRYPDLDLVIVGRSGETLDALRRRIVDRNLEGRVYVRWDMSHGDTLEILYHAELFVLPSRNEGFAIVLLEARAFGKPVVATNVCGVAELIEDGVTGRIVTPEDPTALAAAISESLDDPGSSAKMAARIRSAVQENFTWKQKCAEYLRLAQSGSTST